MGWQEDGAQTVGWQPTNKNSTLLIESGGHLLTETGLELEIGLQATSWTEDEATNVEWS